MIEKIKNAFLNEGYDVQTYGGIIVALINGKVAYRVLCVKDSVHLEDVSTNFKTEFSYNEFLLYLES